MHSLTRPLAHPIAQADEELYSRLATQYGLVKRALFCFLKAEELESHIKAKNVTVLEDKLEIRRLHSAFGISKGILLYNAPRCATHLSYSCVTGCLGNHARVCEWYASFYVLG